tara:strand:+ start:651 stop:1652 length:1002 start_codon:yes stop_codon:yes gene_type:complete
LKNIAIAGATGAVGLEFLKLMESRNFPVKNLKLLASKKSVGKELEFCGEKLPVEELTTNSFQGVDLVFFSAGKGRSKEFVHKAVDSGAIVIDNSSAFRMDPDVPLIVPEINKEKIFENKGIIANPNCSTIQMVVAINPLHKAAKINRVIVSTYQATSGAGSKGMNELIDQTHAWVKNEAIEVKNFPTQIAFNLFPHVDIFLENGYTREEMKMVNETKKIMNTPEMKISATCVRVPVLRAHSEAVWIETENKLSAKDARNILKNSSGIVVKDEPVDGGYPTPWEADETVDTFVGRIREDLSHPNGLTFWVVADQLFKGAALNSLQIAEILISSK